MSSLLNKSAVRKYALEMLKQERPALVDKFTDGGKKPLRVGSEFFDSVEASVRIAIRSRVATQSSVGKTLR